MRQEQPGPIPDAAVRADLTARFGAVLDAGIKALTRALEIDPNYADAMAYINLIIRERGDLRDTIEDYRRDIVTADQWVERALAAKKERAEKAGRMVAPLPEDVLCDRGLGAFLGHYEDGGDVPHRHDGDATPVGRSLLYKRWAEGE